MIKKNLQPELWAVPEWHADFGDATAELEHLRALAAALLLASPGVHIELETPEPGLMNLEIEFPDGERAEVYSLSCDSTHNQCRYALFLSPGTPHERECYSETIEGGVNCLINRSTCQ